MPAEPTAPATAPAAATTAAAAPTGSTPASSASHTGAPGQPSPRLWLAIGAFVAVFGIAGTWALGSAQGWATGPGDRPAAPPVAMGEDAEDADMAEGEGDAGAEEAPHEASAAEIAAMVDRLGERLANEPDNLGGWLMLGRSRAVLGQLDQAAAAFRHVLTRQPGQPEATDGLAQVQALLAQQLQAQAPGGAPADASPAGDRPATAGSATLRGRVTLAPTLAAKVAPGDTVFVFARAAEGPRMPLAIVKKQVRDLPFDFTLDDSTAMTPQTRLSQATRVVVGARISKSGLATPQPGDFEAVSAPVAPGASGLSLVIAEPVR